MPESSCFQNQVSFKPGLPALNFWYGTDKIGTRTAFVSWTTYLDSPGTKGVVRYRRLSVV